MIGGQHKTACVRRGLFQLATAPAAQPVPESIWTLNFFLRFKFICMRHCLTSCIKPKARFFYTPVNTEPNLWQFKLGACFVFNKFIFNLFCPSAVHFQRLISQTKNTCTPSTDYHPCSTPRPGATHAFSGCPSDEKRAEIQKFAMLIIIRIVLFRTTANTQR